MFSQRRHKTAINRDMFLSAYLLNSTRWWVTFRRAGPYWIVHLLPASSNRVKKKKNERTTDTAREEEKSVTILSSENHNQIYFLVIALAYFDWGVGIINYFSLKINLPEYICNTFHLEIFWKANNEIKANHWKFHFLRLTFGCLF